jgi:hypothetical protein
VRRHNHPVLGPSVPAGDSYGITPFLASQQVPVSDPHGLVHAPPYLRLGNGSDTIWDGIARVYGLNEIQAREMVLAPLNQTSQEVTHLGTTLVEVCLTAEFW